MLNVYAYSADSAVSFENIRILSRITAQSWFSKTPVIALLKKFPEQLSEANGVK